MSHARANGPCLVKDVTLRKQATLGWLNENAQPTVNIGGTDFTHSAAWQILSIRKLDTSSLAVTTLKNPSGFVVLLDSTFAGTGGASSLSAIENGADGKLLVRDVSATGFTNRHRFSRIFRQETGTAPAAFRRARPVQAG